MDKYKLIKSSVQGDAKAQQWLDGLLKIPFNIFSKNQILSFKKEFLLKINKTFALSKFINFLNENHFIDINNKFGLNCNSQQPLVL